MGWALLSLWQSSELVLSHSTICVVMQCVRGIPVLMPECVSVIKDKELKLEDVQALTHFEH